MMVARVSALVATLLGLLLLAASRCSASRVWPISPTVATAPLNPEAEPLLPPEIRQDGLEMYAGESVYASDTVVPGPSGRPRASLLFRYDQVQTPGLLGQDAGPVIGEGLRRRLHASGPALLRHTVVVVHFAATPSPHDRQTLQSLVRAGQADAPLHVLPIAHDGYLVEALPEAVLGVVTGGFVFPSGARVDFIDALRAHHKSPEIDEIAQAVRVTQQATGRQHATVDLIVRVRLLEGFRHAPAHVVDAAVDGLRALVGQTAGEMHGVVFRPAASDAQRLSVRLTVSLGQVQAAYMLLRLVGMQSYVQFVSCQLPSSTDNHDARALMESYTASNPDGKLLRGLTGAGELIGVGDSGADTYNCLLADSRGRSPPRCQACQLRQAFESQECYERYVRREPAQECAPPTELHCDFNVSGCAALNRTAHDKLPLYFGYVDYVDLESGHGTHVLGSIAGNLAGSNNASYGTVKQYGGFSSQAQLVFADLGAHEFRGAVWPPDNLQRDYYGAFHRWGARICSNSWGSAPAADMTSAYSQEALDGDQFVLDHRDFLILRSAGNSGRKGWGRVGFQASQKNGLTVGSARTSSRHSTVDVVPYKAGDNYWKSFGEACSHDWWTDKRCEVMTARFPSCAAAQNYYCQLFNSTYSRTVCAELTKDVEWTQLVPRALSCREEELSRVAQEAVDAGYANGLGISDYSSRGPILDDRLKPDILAPGQDILSSRSSDEGAWHCGTDPWAQTRPALTVKSGTSMATPLLAGTAGLIREYYKRGMACSPGCPHEPSAALVKATLLGCGSPRMGRNYHDVASGQVRTLTAQNGDQFIQGHGTVDLSQMMNPAVSTWFVDETSGSVGDGEYSIVMELVVGEHVPITHHAAMSVTLVWTDPPPSLSARLNLVNDLDLEVYTPHCLLYTGNEYLRLDDINSHLHDFEAYRRQDGRFFDRRNNAERVVITGLAPGTYTVRVKGVFVHEAQQSFAVFVNANYQDIYGTTHAEDPLLTDKRRFPVVRAPQNLCPPIGYAQPDGTGHDLVLTIRLYANRQQNYFDSATDAGHVKDDLAVVLPLSRDRLLVEAHSYVPAHDLSRQLCVQLRVKDGRYDPYARQVTASYIGVLMTMMTSAMDIHALDGLVWGSQIDGYELLQEMVASDAPTPKPRFPIVPDSGSSNDGGDGSSATSGVTIILVVMGCLCVLAALFWVAHRLRKRRAATSDLYDGQSVATSDVYTTLDDGMLN